MKVLVTGATGFVGRALSADLIAHGYQVRAAVRREGDQVRLVCTDIKFAVVGDLAPSTDWRAALAGCDAVVHSAARVHVMRDAAADPLDEFSCVNVSSTLNLARQAADAGVKRFVFMSSIKVNGEYTQPGRMFTEKDAPDPRDAYSLSKHEAELGLRQLGTEMSMEVVIIRPPLVYGPGVKANFEFMMRWLARGIPLPLAAVTDNRRSFVALDNLIDLIVTCLNHPAAANQTFLVSDGEDLSTADLLRRMGAALGRPARLFYVPTALLKLGARAVNKPDIYLRLCGSLQLDSAKARQLLGWTPPLSVDEGLRRAAKGFRQ